MFAKIEAEQKHEADRFLRAMDTIRGNQSGLEFMTFEGAKYLHNSLDQDGNGYVTVDELPTHTSGMDVDLDGDISLVEFFSYVSKRAALLEISVDQHISNRYTYLTNWNGKASLKQTIDDCYVTLANTASFCTILQSWGMAPIWCTALSGAKTAMERNVVVEVGTRGVNNALTVGTFANCRLVVGTKSSYSGTWWLGLIGHEFAHCDLADHPDNSLADGHMYYGECNPVGSWNHGDQACSNIQAGGCKRFLTACVTHYHEGSHGCGFLGWGCKQECMPRQWCESYQDALMIALAGSGIYHHRR